MPEDQVKDAVGSVRCKMLLGADVGDAASDHDHEAEQGAGADRQVESQSVVVVCTDLSRF
eukprot:2336856-Rhodomonas_salina.3